MDEAKWPPATHLEPKVSSVAMRQAFEQFAKDNWGSRVDAVILSRPGMRTSHLAVLADTSPPTIDKIRSGDLVPKEYLRFAIAIALGCEVDALFPMPTREEMFARAQVIRGAA